MFESLVEKSKLRPPAKRDINASPFFALPEPCLGTVLFSFIKSKEERRQMTDTVMNSSVSFLKTLILPFAHKQASVPNVNHLHSYRNFRILSE